MKTNSPKPLQLALPKGRMQKSVFELLADAGIQVQTTQRGYRPFISLTEFEAKILKPQNIVEMLHFGSRDIGFTGADWVAELKADLVELLDTNFDRVDLVAAAPIELLKNGGLKNKSIVVASEYKRLTTDWIKKQNYKATFVKSYGATEVFPPEDADCIVDITATGETLRNNGLQIVDVLLSSSTRLYANRKIMDNPTTRDRCEEFALLLKSVLDARERVMLDVNVGADNFDELVKVLPCMKQPTVSPLNGNNAYAVKVAVLRSELPKIIPLIKSAGGTDIVVTSVDQIII